MARGLILLTIGILVLTILVFTASALYPVSNVEQLSPYDRLNEDQIKVYPDRVVIEMKGITWASYADTNSMDPMLDTGANGLELVPKNEDELHVGDIVAYKSSYADGLIVHRIVEINNDSHGKYFVLKGDNNPQVDPEKVRFNQVKYILIGILY